MATNKSPNLFVVATPIGNLGDMSVRAVETLKSSDLILAEDTRHFSIIANKHEIKVKCISNHEHNEKSQINKIIEILKDDKKISIVTDAGTPTISDPGYRLIRACHEENIFVTAIPGPCAAITALSISGLPSNEFCFRGFLPIKSGQKEKIINSSLELEMTTIFYESTHRILKSIELISKLAPEREIFVVRELTKKFEEYFRGNSTEVFEQLKNAASLKGEFVIILSKSN